MITRNALPAGMLVLVLANFQSFAYDTLVYRSPFESRMVNTTVNKTNSDYFSLFLSINSDSAHCSVYDIAMKSFYAQMDRKISSAKSNKQKARIIFDDVHSRFFRKYEDNVLFEKIFEDGTYNCLTASMLYTMVLGRYHIPYEIREKPTHIYLVALPGKDNILFETTSPRGLYAPDEKAKRDYVEGLVAMKLVTREHVNSAGVARTFNEFYYNSENISLQQLAGLQYFNRAVGLYHEKDIDGAVVSAIKANFLYPNNKNLYLKTSLLREALHNSDFKSASDIRYLAELAITASEVSDRRDVLRVFAEVLDTKLIQQGQDAFVNETYKMVLASAVNETLRSELTYNYKLAVAHWQAMKGDMDQALVHAEDAHAINPEDARLQDLIARSLALKTERIRGKAQAIETLDAYQKKFPFLASNKTFKSLMVYQYSLRAYSLFLENSGEEGYKYLTLLEQNLKILEGNPMMMEQLIGMAYAEAGAYHFRKRQFTRAKEILQKGLQTAPGHGEIIERLRIVDQELGR